METVRLAGLLERYHITRHTLGFDSCVLSAAQYIAPKGSELDKKTLFYVLQKVVETHPALGVRLARETERQPAFVRLDKIDPSKLVEFIDSDNLDAVFETQLGQPFDTGANLPLWRLVVVKRNIICFAWHHCIGDGLSGLAFHRSFLAFLRGGIPASHDSANSDNIIIPSAAPLAPAIETVISLTPSWSKVYREIRENFAPTSWTRGASAWTGAVVGKDVTLKTCVRFITFSPEDISEFITLCRTHQATLTSAFQTMATSVLSALITANQITTSTTISCYVPISLRNIAHTSQDVFCNHVSTLHTYPHIHTTFSWAEASRFASVLRSYTVKSHEEIGMLKFLFGRYSAYFKQKLGKKRQGGLELSNLGRFDIHEAQAGDIPWSIGDTTFAQCDVVTGAALKLNVVGNPLGGVKIAVTWGDGAVPNSLVASFVSNFESSFRELLQCARAV